jgi:hypothetical protein
MIWYNADKEFYSAGCGKPKGYKMTNSGPIVTFRLDKKGWNFKNLSVRDYPPHGVISEVWSLRIYFVELLI